MIARDVLAVKSGKIYSVSPDSPVTDAIRLMVESDIGSLVVLDEAGKMIGIITERDMLRASHKYSGDFSNLKVSDLMSTKLFICSPEETVDYVRGIMTENRIRHLPVIENDVLLGVITFHDVAKACLNDVSFENQLLKRYIKQWPDEDQAKV